MQKANAEMNTHFRLQLQAEFSRRLRTRSEYSIRSFAQSLGVNSSTLSQIMAGKRSLSEEKISLLSQKLGLNEMSPPERPDFVMLEQDYFSIISDWYHFALLDLVQIKGFKNDPAWIAKKIGIEKFQVEQALNRLSRVGLLEEVDGKLKKKIDFVTNYTEGFTSAALKEYQRQVIRKALEAVDGCAQERKDITSITIAADSSKIQLAKEKIKNFRRELCLFLEEGERDSVFHFTLQLYPVTRPEENI